MLLFLLYTFSVEDRYIEDDIFSELSLRLSVTDNLNDNSENISSAERTRQHNLS